MHLETIFLSVVPGEILQIVIQYYSEYPQSQWLTFWIQNIQINIWEMLLLRLIIIQLIKLIKSWPKHLPLLCPFCQKDYVFYTFDFKSQHCFLCFIRLATFLTVSFQLWHFWQYGDICLNISLHINTTFTKQDIFKFKHNCKWLTSELC